MIGEALRAQPSARVLVPVARPSLLSVDTSWAAALPRDSSPAAFDWWYLDGRDADGDGLVFIWAGRLPFFPDDAPSINLCLYRRSRPVFWLLQQHPRAALRVLGARDGFVLELGGSRLSLARAAGELRLEAFLDLALPADTRRLTGTLRAAGPCPLGDGPPLAHPHRWVPLAPAARVAADLRWGKAPFFSFAGKGYVDRNLGDAPLHALGLRRWSWGRAREKDRCTSWYALEGSGGEEEAWRLDADPGGLRVTRAPAPERERGRVVRIGGLRVGRGRPVERGPFYSRSFGVLPDGGAPVIAERCEVSRIGLGWQRPLVRMRVHRVGAESSFWLPLFSGPREGRLSRLLLRGSRR